MFKFCSWFALVFLMAAPVGAEITGRVQIIDGDTIDVGDTRVRLHGIDAPERGQPCTTTAGQDWACGDWVTRQVRDRFEGQHARCTQVDRDKYGRTVARCAVDQTDMGREIVQQGWAFAYRRYSMAYDLDEKAALVAKVGIHGHQSQSPRRYRLSQRRAAAPNPDCHIKGNISLSGVKIYHLPGQAFYQRTGINAARGEQWFCSEAQARASGWRRAKR